MKKLELGQVVMTVGIAQLIEENDLFNSKVMMALNKHTHGDWGELSKEDKESNDFALENEERILSAYNIDGIKIWIITEWDRSATTILLPDEY